MGLKETRPLLAQSGVDVIHHKGERAGHVDLQGLLGAGRLQSGELAVEKRGRPIMAAPPDGR
jgi:hypothetical protein